MCGQDFYALNGGPMFSFTPAISFFLLEPLKNTLISVKILMLV
ncbi:VOC family protein [bacterium]|nr:VOC family protein [bacterium]